MNIKKGSVVGRISYGSDIIFSVKRIIRMSNGKKFAILKGLTVRIEADSPVEDLVLIEKDTVKRSLKDLDSIIEKRIKKNERENELVRREVEKQSRAVILHLDGDRKYAEKSLRYYKNLGLYAVVKNISENKQADYVTDLLERYQPDILVITGHDAMIKSNRNYNDINNYRNSRHFVNAVRKARKWAEGKKDLTIFAGACQSYFEALMLSGANFASSPRSNFD